MITSYRVRLVDRHTLKCMTLEQWQEATKPRYYGDIRYKPAGVYMPPVEVPEATTHSEPAAADSSSEEEEEEEEALQVIVSEKEREKLTGTAANRWSLSGQRQRASRRPSLGQL